MDQLAVETLKIGDRIRATHDIDLDHHAYVERGETGTVVAIEVEAGDSAPTVFIRLDKPHWGRAQFRNDVAYPRHGSLRIVNE